MEYFSIERPVDAFQLPVTPQDILAMSQRAFGRDTEVASARELSGGLYNSTYWVEIKGGSYVVLRVAPKVDRQSRLEWRLMRNEYAATPYFAPLAHMIPRIIFVDWTGELTCRDYMFQTLLDGLPAVDGLKLYPRASWGAYYQQLGSITAEIHKIRGERFGPVYSHGFTKWSDSVLAVLANVIADMIELQLDAHDFRQAFAAITLNSDLLDEITEPRLLHGDLWTPNILLAEDGREPKIVGLVDHDRAWWGDPAADWSFSVLAGKPAEAQAAFLSTYGQIEVHDAAQWRSTVYRVLHLGAVRLERQRTGKFSKMLKATTKCGRFSNSFDAHRTGVDP
jgi:aminoglycoside phosphotransferase (APT) family kinase protein